MAGMVIGTAGRGFGVAKAFLVRLIAGRTDWFFAAKARFASKGFSTSVTLCQHWSTEGFFLRFLFFFDA